MIAEPHIRLDCLSTSTSDPLRIADRSQLDPLVELVSAESVAQQRLTVDEQMAMPLVRLSTDLS